MAEPVHPQGGAHGGKLSTFTVYSPANAELPNLVQYSTDWNVFGVDQLQLTQVG